MEGAIGDNKTINNKSIISTEARQALHMGTEDHTIQTLQAANVYAAHDNHVTLKLKDLRLVETLSNVEQIINLANGCNPLIIPTVFI